MCTDDSFWRTAGKIPCSRRKTRRRSASRWHDRRIWHMLRCLPEPKVDSGRGRRPPPRSCPNPHLRQREQNVSFMQILSLALSTSRRATPSSFLYRRYADTRFQTRDYPGTSHINLYVSSLRDTLHETLTKEWREGKQ